jgi:2-amino-4,5-dihydroxy-6-oxo-7-(phosphonooxy)heptanoate synthase
VAQLPHQEVAVTPLNDSFARRIRLRRLHHGGARLFVVPLDHSVTDGPVVRNAGLDELVGQLATNGADAIVVHKGRLRQLDPRWFDAMSVIVHLSASTGRAPDPDAKVLVAGVAEALRLGADGVSVHVNLGSTGEARQLADLAAVAGACHRWSLPLLAMVYPRGPRIADSSDPELVAHAATVAADLGADLVKTVYPGSAAAMANVARSCPIPILVAGGAPAPSQPGMELLGWLQDALDGGAGGVAVGRGVFTAADPGVTARKIAGMVHDLGNPMTGEGS